MCPVRLGSQNNFLEPLNCRIERQSRLQEYQASTQQKHTSNERLKTGSKWWSVTSGWVRHERGCMVIFFRVIPRVTLFSWCHLLKPVIVYDQQTRVSHLSCTFLQLPLLFLLFLPCSWYSRRFSSFTSPFPGLSFQERDYESQMTIQSKCNQDTRKMWEKEESRQSVSFLFPREQHFYYRSLDHSSNVCIHT